MNEHSNKTNILNDYYYWTIYYTIYNLDNVFKIKQFKTRSQNSI